MNALVSVLMPYRNAAATIDEAVQSVLEQTHETLELIAVDDGSTDDGPSRVQAWAERDHRVRPLACGGLGIAAALSRGLKGARGQLIARMDADDICRVERLRRQVERMLSCTWLGATGTRVEAFPHAGDGLRRYIAWQNNLVSEEDHRRELFVESPLCHPSVMLRRDALEQVGGWRDVAWAEDYDLWLRLDACGWKMAKVPVVLLGWRHQAGRATFCDPRYSLERFRQAKAQFVAQRVTALGRPVVLWGAGQTGKRMARALEPWGIRPVYFVDIDPRKIGSSARGVAIHRPEQLRRGEHTVVVAVGARGARDEIRGYLTQRKFVEGDDYLFCA